MKKRLIAASVLINVALMTTLIWVRLADEAKFHELSRAAMTGDDLHLKVHAVSLAAIASGDPEKVANALRILRPLIAAGDANNKARAQLGLSK
jgi:hypothetical protein